MPSKGRKRKGKGKAASGAVDATDLQEVTSPSTEKLAVEDASTKLPLAGSSLSPEAPTPKPQARSKKGGSKPTASPSDVTSNPLKDSETPKKRATGAASFNSRKGRFEYQHFIPRLVLREFATPESRSAAVARGDPRNPDVKVYTLDKGSITPQPVGRCYGYMNMYRDAGASLADEMHIEQALSVLEGQAAQIITRIKKAQAQNARSVTLTRQERNCIRKFLFVMKFRTPLFWRKYKCSVEDYQHVDREEVLKFMKQRGFEKPIEVWLHSLKTILDTPVDANEEWERIVVEKCFIHDGLWYLLHMNGSFMSFCQPADPDDEFIVSESAFGIHEGPTEAWSSFFPEGTKQKKTVIQGPDIPDLSSEERKLHSRGWYTEYHHLAPCSPRLLLVLRSNELRDEESKRRFRARADLGLPGSHQWKIPSAFDHLHLEPPEPSYVGHVTPENFRLSDDHTFTFKLQKLSRKDLVLFNSIILNEVRKTLTWQSDLAMKRTLEAYLTEERFRLPMSHLLFLPGEDPEITRREQLHNLLGMLERGLGEEMKVPPPSLGSHVQGMLEFERNLQKNPLAKGYFKLGGLATNWTRDMFQSSLASKLRNSVADALPPGDRNRPYRNAAFRNVLGVLASLPPTVIYLHINVWRIVQENRQSKGRKTREELMTQCMNERGAEDAVADVAGDLPREQLSRLMLYASFRRVCQREPYGDPEGSCYSNFGGIESSFLIEGTRWHDPRVGAVILSPYRDQQIPPQQMMKEFFVRWEVKRSDFIKDKWGAAVDAFVWEWLYEVPEVDI